MKGREQQQQQQVTEMLAAWSAGDKDALDKLMPVVANELRRFARAQMNRENPNHTLQTTALINEAYLKLIEQRNFKWESRAHFFAIAAKLMRRILLDYARSKLREKRGGGAPCLNADEMTRVLSTEKTKELVALDEALEYLSKIDPLKGRIVELRYFGGLSVEETAEALKIAPATVMRHWSLAKAWLKCEIQS